MFPPIPAPFAGSMHQETNARPRMPRLLDRSFAALSLLTAATVWLCATQGNAPLTWADATKLACAAMLLPAILGLWLMEQADESPSLAVTRIYSLVQQRLRADHAGAVPLHGDEGTFTGLAGLIAGSVGNLRRLQAGRQRIQEAALCTNQALQTGRTHALLLAAHLRTDGSAMAEAATGIMIASARLTEDATATRLLADGADHAVSGVVDQAMSLAGTVRLITEQIDRMTIIAVHASECAFGAQANLAGLDERTSALARSTDQVGRALQLASACGHAARRQSNSHTADPGISGVSADLSANLREMAICADAALADMQETVCFLRKEAGLASRQVAELSDLIGAQHALGDTISHAVGQQGTEIAQVLESLQKAHAGFITLRAGVDAVTRHGEARLTEAEAMRGAAYRMPGHADAIAGIFRNVPDFAPKLEF